MREWESASKQGSKQGTVTHNQSLPTETGPAFSPLEQSPLTVVAGLVALVVVVVSLLGSEDGEGDVGEEEIERRNRVLSFFDSVHSLTRSPSLISAVRASMCLTVAVLKSLPHLDIPSINRLH